MPARRKKPDDPTYVEGSPIPVYDLPGIDMRRASEGMGTRRRRETLDLRAELADVVHEYTSLKRRDQIAHGVAPHDAVEIVEEYDPVVAMALLAVSTKNVDQALQAHAQVAQYVRPKLKSVEVIQDAAKLQDLAARNAKAASIVESINAVARARRLAHDAEVLDKGVILDQPDEVLR